MSYTIVYVDIYCNKLLPNVNPSYRVFLDDQLIVERQFWPDTPDYFIQEHITLKDDDNLHKITVKNVFVDRGDITVHSIGFFDGNNRTTLNYAAAIKNNQIMFNLPKR